jgi:hypothetical protein
MNKFLLLFVIIFCFSCGGLSPHNNFKAHMSSMVGKSITSPYTWIERFHRKRWIMEMKNMDIYFAEAASIIFILRKTMKSLLNGGLKGAKMIVRLHHDASL